MLNENGFKMIKQGAEAKLYTGTYIGKPVIVKERFIKKYRHPELDLLLTKDRMKAEARAIVRCKSAGIYTPSIYLVDFDRRRIYMEHYTNCISVKDFICQHEENLTDNMKKLKIVSQLIGTNLGKMHKNNIIHGDLTTSNMLLVNKNYINDFSNLENLKFALIDFGLAHIESSAEDKGVDLYVLERALLSTHKVTDSLLPVIFDAYKAAMNKKEYNQVIKKLEEVRARGRKRTMIG